MRHKVMEHRIVKLRTTPRATALPSDPAEPPPAMGIDPRQAKFGRHESFPLRFGWIPKGLSALREHASVFTHEDATVTLGVGKNMVSSMRHWLLAARLVRPSVEGQGLEPSAIAQMAFGPDSDPYLEDDGTIWLLHWLLATNPAGATAVYWFFNHFHSASFTAEEVATALRDFVHRDISPRTAVATLKRDATLVLRMYARSRIADQLALEDSLDSPLAMLGLQRRIDSRTWRSVPEARADIPLFVFTFAVAELFQYTGRAQLPIQDLMYSSEAHCAPGAVFRMTEEGLINKLEAMCLSHSDLLVLDRTAGVFQLYKRGPLPPLEILRDTYSKTEQTVAA